ncbi:leucine-rich repeat domain-containing protein [Paludisphaera mucosa]|uniref:Leucine Rich repeats (2 copies) n=1 Tax=Paludisphaera mucosa TaxID=3030827 RepID=A0ABT6FKF2_9BACT|nr:hypothetical protein [Paludisphaera mucosa]MDG3008052.1 hypothetical protein [Paludisphaera mucosa]
MEPASGRALRRRLRFSLRAAMLLILGLGLWLGWQARLAREQREAVAAVEEYGGFVRYDWEFVDDDLAPGAAPWAPGWLRRAIGEHDFQSVAEVNMVYSTDRRGKPDLTPRESDALMAKLTAFPRLRYLYIPGELATDRAMETIEGLTELETLRMWDAKVTDAGVAKMRALRKLKVLQISEAGLGDDSLAHLASLARLERLDLAGNRFTDAGLAHLGGLKALAFLGVNRSKVSDAGLDQLRTLTNLQELWVAGTAVSDEGVIRLQAAMPNLSTVR